ncbi:hypothetical protein B0H12DRAFT_32950 [Mycena haematopus]|nr:hypothetical protein B0H12DRAFT_32950 [Mycena haematopus]
MLGRGFDSQTLNISGGRGGNGGKGGVQGGSGGAGQGPSFRYDIKAQHLENLTLNNVTHRVLGRERERERTLGRNQATSSAKPLPLTSFGSHAGHFTLRKGVSNNIHGNVVHNTFVNYGKKRPREEIRNAPDLLTVTLGETARDDYSPEEEDDIDHLKLSSEIGRGPGYYFSVGKIKGRAVIVQVFDRGPTQRKRFESIVSLSRGLMHPNLLRIKETSSPMSSIAYIAYENAFWKFAAGPLATALKDDLERSVILGFKMISQLSVCLSKPFVAIF